mgnify:CR=1 FL=1
MKRFPAFFLSLAGKRFPLESVKEAMEESAKVAHGGKVLLEG